MTNRVIDAIIQKAIDEANGYLTPGELVDRTMPTIIDLMVAITLLDKNLDALEGIRNVI